MSKQFQSGHGEADHGNHDAMLKEMPSVNDVIVEDPHSSHHHHQVKEYPNQWFSTTLCVAKNWPCEFEFHISERIG